MADFEFTDEELSEDFNNTHGLSDIVVFSSDWTTETIVSQLKRAAIDINPMFQRRDAWDLKKKSRFIESLMMGLPVPQVVLAELRKGSYSVLDGKQRLLTLMQFFGLSEDSKKKFKLHGCDLMPILDGKNIKDFQTDENLCDLYNSLLNQTIRSVIVRNCTNPRILELIFIRLNTGSVQLSSHELRLARFPGSFMKFADEESCKSEELHSLLGMKNIPDFRMRDSELLTRFFSFKYFLEKYDGNLSEFMDESTESLNSMWDEEEDKIKESLNNFKNGCSFIKKVFEEGACKKWLGDKYETRFNRAIFDALMYYFSDKEILEACSGKENAIENAFKQLCTNNNKFVESISSTTKKVSAVYNRISLWGNALSSSISYDIPLPQLVENKIIRN
jgi:hypothetical protein